VESPFAAVGLRTDAAKRYRRVASATAVIWKILVVAQSRLRPLDAPGLLADVYHGAPYADGGRTSERKRKGSRLVLFTHFLRGAREASIVMKRVLTNAEHYSRACYARGYRLNDAFDGSAHLVTYLGYAKPWQDAERSYG
jgi:hypothetical protein